MKDSLTCTRMHCPLTASRAPLFCFNRAEANILFQAKKCDSLDLKHAILLRAERCALLQPYTTLFYLYSALSVFLCIRNPS